MTKRLPPSSADSSPGDPLAGASIRVVANRTGIAADTLRVWERRYGFPKPERRPGGSRIYSEQDIARLRLLARALDAGFRPSEVVPLSFADVTRLVDASIADAPAPVAASDAARSRSARPPYVGSPVDAALVALRADDLVGLRAVLRAAAIALGPRTFVTDVAHPLALRVGELWAQGLLEVRHEHLASACLTSQLHLLLGALDDGVRSPTVLLATLSGEPHVLGLDMVGVYLAASLAAPHLLGADTPPAQITEAARAFAVDVVGISISPAADGAAAAIALAAIAKALPARTELWLGGGGARPVAIAAPTARLFVTWPDIDAALAAWRAGARKR